MDKGSEKTDVTVPGLRKFISGKIIIIIPHTHTQLYYSSVSAMLEVFTGYKFGTLLKRLPTFLFSPWSQEPARTLLGSVRLNKEDLSLKSFSQ